MLYSELTETEKAYFSPFGGGTETNTNPARQSRPMLSHTILLLLLWWTMAEPSGNSLIPLAVRFVHPLQ